MNRTVRIRLRPSPEQAPALHETMRQFTASFNAVCRGGWERRLHAWSFHQLRAFLEYKAETKGCRVVGIDPRYTSQRCHVCGHTERANRKSQSQFWCRKCGHRQNADLNGAKNVCDKHLVGWAICLPGGPSSTGLSSRISLPWNGGCFGPGTS